MSDLIPTAVWRMRPDVVVALAKSFGDPIDSYVNGSQVWLQPNGPREITIEWRMHPVPGYSRPADIDTIDVFPLTALGLSDDDELAELPAPLSSLWDGLEAFPAYGEECEPQELADACASAIGIPADAFGLVNHEATADAWERANRSISITDALLKELLASG